MAEKGSKDKGTKEKKKKAQHTPKEKREIKKSEEEEVDSRCCPAAFQPTTIWPSAARSRPPARLRADQRSPSTPTRRSSSCFMSRRTVRSEVRMAAAIST